MSIAKRNYNFYNLYDLSKSIENELEKNGIEVYVSIYTQIVPAGVNVLIEYFDVDKTDQLDFETTYRCEALIEHTQHSGKEFISSLRDENKYLRYPYWVVKNFDENLPRVKDYIFNSEKESKCVEGVAGWCDEDTFF